MLNHGLRASWPLVPASLALVGGVAQAQDKPADSLETVIVTSERLPDEYGGGQIARGSRLGLLGNRDVMDTPFSTTSYTAQMMEDIEARSLAQVIVADPSVHFAGSTSRTYDGFEIRGFAVQSQSVMFDGLYARRHRHRHLAQETASAGATPPRERCAEWYGSEPLRKAHEGLAAKDVVGRISVRSAGA